MPECCCCIRLDAPIHKRKNGGINDPGKGRLVFLATTDFMQNGFHSGILHLLSTLTNTVASITSVRAGKILGDAKDFCVNSPKLAWKKTPKKWPPKKTSSCAFVCHFIQIKVYGVHFHPSTTSFYISDINAVNKSKTHILPLFGFYTQHLKRWNMREVIVSWCWLRKRGFFHTKLQENFRKLKAVTCYLTKQDAIYRSRIEFLKQKVTFVRLVIQHNIRPQNAEALIGVSILWRSEIFPSTSGNLLKLCFIKPGHRL